MIEADLRSVFFSFSIVTQIWTERCTILESGDGNGDFGIFWREKRRGTECLNDFELGIGSKSLEC